MASIIDRLDVIRQTNRVLTSLCDIKTTTGAEGARMFEEKSGIANVRWIRLAYRQRYLQESGLVVTAKRFRILILFYFQHCREVYEHMR